MVIGVPKELDSKKVANEVNEFSKKYKLSKTEQDELTFIMNTFCKYYNKMSEADQMFEQTAIIDSFEGVLETITTTYNGTGIQTRADIYWKQIPCVMKMLTDSSNAAKSADTDTKKKKIDSSCSDSSSTGSSVNSARRAYHVNNTTHSTPSYGGCGSSYAPSHHSSYQSYGGCGGGGGYSGGGHC